MSRRAQDRRERATLIVPASKPSVIAKAAAAEADAVCIDCEDAVAPDAKAEARPHVIEALNALDFGDKLKQVRINALDTPFAYRDLIEIVEAAGAALDLIVLPKAEAAKDVAFVDTLLTQIETACSLPHRIAISPMIETAKGLQNVAEITAASPRLAALIFGSGDFAASMNMPLATIGGEDAYDEAYSGHRWHHVMQSLLTAARANGLRAIDGPYADFKDPSGLQRLSILGRGLGFDGKWCIHPAQLETVLKAYTPSDAEIASADRIVTAYHAAQTSGLGVISVDGKMVDAANLRMARQTLARAGRDTKDN